MKHPVDLSRNSALTTLELRLVYPRDLVQDPPRLRKTLSTISSPAFSEFTLRFEGDLSESRLLRTVTGEAVWGDQWGGIDGKLDDMIHVIGRNIRLVIQIGECGGAWVPSLRALVEAAFPLLNARGLVSVEVVKFSAETDRIVW